MKTVLYEKLEEKINGKVRNGKVSYDINELVDLFRKIRITREDAIKIADELVKMNVLLKETDRRYIVPKNFNSKFAVNLAMLFLLAVIWGNAAYWLA